MSLSLGPDIDMQAIINGGPQFVARLAKFQEEATKHKQALDNLNLGKSAAAANTEAGRLLAAAKEKHDAMVADANKQAEDTSARLKAHEAATKAATYEALNAVLLAKAETDTKLAAADDLHKHAAKVMADADEYHRTRTSEVDAKAAKILADAKAAAEKHISDAKTHRDAAKADRDDAAALKAKLEEKLARIKSLAGD